MLYNGGLMQAIYGWIAAAIAIVFTIAYIVLYCVIAYQNNKENTERIKQEWKSLKSRVTALEEKNRQRTE